MGSTLLPFKWSGCVSQDLPLGSRAESTDIMPEKSPGQGTLIVAALIVLGIVFAGHWIVSYVQSTNPWAIIPWYGVAAVLIIVLGNLRWGGG
jgi:hypothetical protein